MKISRISTALLGLCLPILSGAKSWEAEVSIEDSMRWSKLDFLDPYNIVTAATGQENEVWFVHNSGLLRYDGRELQSFPISESELRGTLDLFVSSTGLVCILTTDHLIVWRDGDYQLTGRFSNQIIRRESIVEDADGHIFIATDVGLFVLVDGELSQVDTGDRRPAAILFDGNGLLWMVDAESHDIGVHQVKLGSGGGELEERHHFAGPTGNTIAQDLFLDSRQRVWVFDRDEIAHICYFEDYQKVRPFDQIDLGTPTGVYATMAESLSGDFWMATTHKLVRLRGDEITYHDNYGLSLPTTFPYLLELSNDRLLLGGVGYTPRLVNLSTEEWTTYRGLNFQCEDENGGEWFITDDHEVVRHADGEWHQFEASAGLIDRPNRLTLGSDGTIWASGAHGNAAAVARYNNATWTASLFPELGTVFSHLSVIETSEGAMIFGAGTPTYRLGEARGGGVIFRRNGSKFDQLHVPPPTFLPRTSTMVEIEGYGLLLGSGNLFRSSPNATFSADRYDIIHHRWIDHMMVDTSNVAWIACSGVGVYEFDGEQFTLHGLDSGLREKNVVYLVEDKKRTGVLVLTEGGVFRFDGTGWSRWGRINEGPFRRETHTVFQDSAGAFWINSASRSWFLDGKMNVGPNYAFKTVRYDPESNPPDTLVTIADADFPEGSQVQIQFKGSDYWAATAASDLDYSWKLDGGPWSAFSTDSYVTLNDVEVGDHVLMVRARDRSGNVDETPAQVSFRVNLPVWKQSWFILISSVTVILVALLIYLLFRVRIKAALAIDEFKLDFFTNLSHELRNPLAVIMSPAELLLKSENDAAKRNKLQIILRNARKLQSMVDQLLQFRRIDQGNRVPRLTGGEVISFIKESVYNLETLWLDKQQTLDLALDPETFLCLFNPDTVQQTVDNLLSNAIKYSGPNTHLAVIAKVAMIDGHQSLTFSVTDQGPGIPLHEQENVLEPFYRLEKGRENEGSGIGLALVNQLVSSSGGKISIQSPVTKDDKGTCVTVMLPLEAYVESKAMDPLEEIPEERPDETPVLLMIEDNEDLRQILTRAFSNRYHILESGDGMDGFEQAHKWNPDLIVSDIMMPGMDGYALCEKLKSDPETSHIPVILLTAKNSSEHRLKGLKAGADAYLSKPLDLDHLQARVDNLLESRRELKRKFARQLLIEPTEVTVTSTDELILRKALKIVEEHMQDEDFDVNTFSGLMGLSVASLRRKLKAVTGQTPLAFIQKMRIKRAAHLLATTDLQVADVGSRVGIYDQSYFGKLFRKETGVAPSGYKESQLRKKEPTA
jgi:signal transduction histidine kinase/DNA-binding response OmpR family regulator